MWKKVSSEFRSVFGVDEEAYAGHMSAVKQSVLDGTSKWSAKIAITGLWPARCARRSWPVMHPLRATKRWNVQRSIILHLSSLYTIHIVCTTCVPQCILLLLLLLLLIIIIIIIIIIWYFISLFISSFAKPYYTPLFTAFLFYSIFHFLFSLPLLLPLTYDPVSVFPQQYVYVIITWSRIHIYLTHCCTSCLSVIVKFNFIVESNALPAAAVLY